MTGASQSAIPGGFERTSKARSVCPPQLIANACGRHGSIAAARAIARKLARRHGRLVHEGKRQADQQHHGSGRSWLIVPVDGPKEIVRESCDIVVVGAGHAAARPRWQRRAWVAVYAW